MRRERSRKFPYYYVVEVNGTRMTILDINSIQTRVQEEKGYSRSFYDDNVENHVTKEIEVPGSTEKEKKANIKWMNDMMDGANNTIIVYDHRRNTLHEEYKVAPFVSYEEDVLGVVPEGTEEELVEDEEDEDEDLE